MSKERGLGKLNTHRSYWMQEKREKQHVTYLTCFYELIRRKRNSKGKIKCIEQQRTSVCGDPWSPMSCKELKYKWKSLSYKLIHSCPFFPSHTPYSPPRVDAVGDNYEFGYFWYLSRRKPQWPTDSIYYRMKMTSQQNRKIESNEPCKIEPQMAASPHEFTCWLLLTNI